ncbi:DNA cytosine methyltransferase [Salinibacter pepae]|uniref:DNA cytosine methyltransferase n=1 Tax=Salinibacter pepae TaxID=3040382 RepID=UPI0021E9A263|nr:DNA cytosine methyltransferase [Salinibacter pepae]
MPETDSEYQYPLVSLFTGAGGLDIGLEKAGFNTVFANDNKDWACETIKRNRRLSGLTKQEFGNWFNKQIQQRCHKYASDEEIENLRRRVEPSRKNKSFLNDANVVQGDISDISSQQIMDAAGIEVGEASVVAGGPPCQSFSRSGDRESVEVDKGQLFVEFVRVVDDLEPSWFIFENVKGLETAKTDVLYEVCLNCGNQEIPLFAKRQEWTPEASPPSSTCSTCGSNKLEWELEEEKGGSLKIIINEFEKRAGYDCQYKVLNAANFGAPQKRKRLFIVGSEDGSDFSWPSPTHMDPNKNGFQVDAFASSNGARRPWVTMWDAIWKDGHFKYGELDPDVARLWVRNVVRPKDEPVTWRLDKRPSPTVGAHQAAKLSIAPNGVPEKQIERQQWHTKGNRQGDTPPVEVEYEFLSDGELLMLQTFSQNRYLYGTRMQRAKQIGNAVPPLLGEVVGEAVAEAMETRKASSYC